MSPPRRFRFGLRSFLIGCTLAALAVGFIGSQFVAHDRWLRSICIVGGTAGFRGFNTSHDHYLLTYYRDHKSRPVAYVLCVYDPYIPNLPAMRRRYSYTSWQGGVLRVDDEIVDPAAGPVLFVNGAYGYTSKIKLTNNDLAALNRFESGGMNECIQYWRERVEPQLYKLKGNFVGRERDGPWRYESLDGKLYLEAHYQLGERDGEWISYYPNGAVQFRQSFKAGKPEGRWEYFDGNGELLGSLEWKDGFVVDSSRSGGGGASSAEAGWVESNGKRTAFSFTEGAGGVFWIEGRKMERPPLHAAE